MRFLRPSKAALAAVLSTALLGACGSKGPLYFRDNPPPGLKVPKPPAPKPVPYPEDPAANTPGGQEKQD